MSTPTTTVVSGHLDDPLAGVRPSQRAREAIRWERAVMRPGRDLERLDDLVRQAARATDAPLGTVSLMSDRQVLASVVFTRDFPVAVARGRQAPMDDTACLVPVRAGSTTTIVDARRDSRVSGLTMTQAEVFRAYLGVPLRAVGGEVVAVLCVYDHEARDWSDVQREALEHLADDVTAELIRIVSRADREAASAPQDASPAAESHR